MEIDVTEYVEEHDCTRYSNSIANSGLQNIGEITWRNAMEETKEHCLVAESEQDTLRDWIRQWGAWDDEEIAKMSNQETNALLLQFIASEIQEMAQSVYEEDSPGGALYQGDDKRWYYYVGM